jgi:hypothetical protein
MNVKICNINYAYQNITRNARKSVLVYSVTAAIWQNIQTAGKTECDDHCVSMTVTYKVSTTWVQAEGTWRLVGNGFL